MKVSRLVIHAVCLLGLWLGMGLQAHGQTRTVHYYYTDPQGTPLVKTDAQGNVIARYDYTPYGNAVTSLGSPPNGPGYTGHVNDPETGLVYMQARYYQPNGRFLSPDPMGPVPGNVFSFNRYGYGNGNPIANTDPTGMQDCDDNCMRMRQLSNHFISMASGSSGESSFAGTSAGLEGQRSNTSQSSSGQSNSLSENDCDTPECEEYRRTNAEILRNQGRALKEAGLFAGKFAAINFLGDGIGKIIGKLGALGKLFGLANEEVGFGRNANQLFHTFRHVESAGLDRGVVQEAIRGDLRSSAALIRSGEPFNQTITVDGKEITYTAYRLGDGSINVGRITLGGK